MQLQISHEFKRLCRLTKSKLKLKPGYKYNGDNEFDAFYNQVKFDLKSNHDIKRFIKEEIKGNKKNKQLAKSMKHQDSVIYKPNMVQVIDGMTLFMIRSYDSNKIKDKINNSELKMLEIINKTLINYLLATNLIKSGNGNYVETSLGNKLINHPHIYLDRYFRDHTCIDYDTYVPMSDILSPILSNLKDYVGYQHPARYRLLNGSLGVAFMYGFVNIKRLDQMSRRNNIYSQGVHTLNLNPIEYFMLLMVFMSDFLSYCNRKYIRNNDSNINKSTLKVFIDMCKANRFATDMFYYVDIGDLEGTSKRCKNRRKVIGRWIRKIRSKKRKDGKKK